MIAALKSLNAYSDELSVEETVGTKLQVEMLCKALRQLTPSQREVIGLRFAGLSSAEVVKSGAKAAVRSGRSDAPPAIEKLRKLMW